MGGSEEKKRIARERTVDTEDEQLAGETSLPGIKFPVEVVARTLERLQTRGEFRPALSPSITRRHQTTNSPFPRRSYSTSSCPTW